MRPWVWGSLKSVSYKNREGSLNFVLSLLWSFCHVMTHRKAAIRGSSSTSDSTSSTTRQKTLACKLPSLWHSVIVTQDKLRPTSQLRLGQGRFQPSFPVSFWDNYSKLSGSNHYTGQDWTHISTCRRQGEAQMQKYPFPSDCQYFRNPIGLASG